MGRSHSCQDRGLNPQQPILLTATPARHVTLTALRLLLWDRHVTGRVEASWRSLFSSFRSPFSSQAGGGVDALVALSPLELSQSHILLHTQAGVLLHSYFRCPIAVGHGAPCREVHVHVFFSCSDGLRALRRAQPDPKAWATPYISIKAVARRQ